MQLARFVACGDVEGFGKIETNLLQPAVVGFLVIRIDAFALLSIAVNDIVFVSVDAEKSL